MAKVYDLTPMTRKADQGRRYVIGGFDVQKRTLWLSVIGAVPGIAIFAVLFPWLQMWALLAVPVCIAISFWAFEGRQSGGMQLRNWRAFVDRRKSKVGKFYICNRPIDISTSELTWLRTMTAPADTTGTSDDEIFNESAPATRSTR